MTEHGWIDSKFRPTCAIFLNGPSGSSCGHGGGDLVLLSAGDLCSRDLQFFNVNDEACGGLVEQNSSRCVNDGSSMC